MPFTWTGDPVTDYERYSARIERTMRGKSIGRCEHCGHLVLSRRHAEWEDEMPYKINGVLLHEGCIMDYAHENCRVER
jgi:hypothetical protein